MTNSVPEFENAIKVLLEIAKLVTDPNAEQKIKKMQQAITAPIEWAAKVNPTTEERDRSPEKGTCPTCGRQYTFTGEMGGIRRHGRSGKCVHDKQMAAEIIPAVWLIADLGDETGDRNHGDNGTEHPNADNI